MNEYLKAQNKTNELVMGNELNSGELDRFSKADFRWAEGRAKGLSKRSVKKGEIYQFEFGKGYEPEIAYERRGLVIGVHKKRLLYVLPIYTYDPKKHTDVYHPTDFPSSHSDLFLLKKSEFSFIKHDSVLKLNDLRTVSINRILYSQNGSIDISSETYKQIENLAFLKLFPSISHDFSESLQKINDLNEEIQHLRDRQALMERENDTLKALIK